MDTGNIVLNNLSFLRARDPSILAWNIHGLDEVRVNLAQEFSQPSTSRENTVTEKKEHLQVFLRIKNGIPLENIYNIDGNNLICYVPDGSRTLRNVKEDSQVTKTFSFSKIFKSETKQIEMFNDCLKQKILNFINGKSSTLFTYGASSSGKTFTIVGTAEQPGLIPRSLEYIFRTIPSLQEEPKIIILPNGEMKYIDKHMYQKEKLQKSAILNATVAEESVHIKAYKQMQQRLSSEPVAEIEDSTNISVSMWITFAEIYNENIYDLLKKPPPRGQQRPKLRLGNTKDGCFIKDLTSVHVSSGLEAYQILQFGLDNLNYAATAINSHSSRSHCIFTIKLIQSSEVEEGVCCSIFNFCDLAGSERVKKTMNVGDRLTESKNINTSLLVLGRCISNIRSAQQFKDNRLIPFRESKLTQLLQKALMGMEDIAMIANLNPSQDMFDESQHILNFSAAAKHISIEEKHPKMIKLKKKNRFSEYMEKKTTSVASIPQEDERDIEINRLKIIISDMYDEMQHQKREFKVELQMDKEYVISCYRELIDDLTKQHDTATAELRKENAKLKQQINYYVSSLNQTDVIVIDSSSEEEDSSPEKKSYKKKVEEDAKTISELKQKIVSLQQDNCQFKFEIERLKKENQQLPKLEEQIRIQTQKATDLDITLKEAEQAFSELQQELHQERIKQNKLISENLQLIEANEHLEEHLLSSNTEN